MNIINSYTSALIKLASELNIEKELTSNVFDFLEVIQKEEAIINFLNDRLYSFKQKSNFILSLSDQGYNQIFLNFLNVLIKEHEQKNLIQILKNYIKAKDLESGIIKGQIFSTMPLSIEAVNKIEKLISDRLSQKITLINNIDSNLISGIKVQVGDKIFNYSIEEKLNLLKKELLK